MVGLNRYQLRPRLLFVALTVFGINYLFHFIFVFTSPPYATFNYFLFKNSDPHGGLGCADRCPLNMYKKQETDFILWIELLLQVINHIFVCIPQISVPPNYKGLYYNYFYCLFIKKSSEYYFF